MFSDPLTQKISEFLHAIGIGLVRGPVAADSFLPGIFVRNGKLVVDESKLKYPGDLLHEAGHLAVAPGNIRSLLSDEVDLPGFDMDAIEAGAIAWSYAAALHLGLDPGTVFHKDGYKGRAESLLFNFSLGIYLGVNVLEGAMMTRTGENDGSPETAPYPHMLKWLRD